MLDAFIDSRGLSSRRTRGIYEERRPGENIIFPVTFLYTVTTPPNLCAIERRGVSKQAPENFRISVQ